MYVQKVVYPKLEIRYVERGICLTAKSTMIELKLQNVAIANALQLEAARATPALSRFNYEAMPTLKSLNLSIAVL